MSWRPVAPQIPTEQMSNLKSWSCASLSLSQPASLTQGRCKNVCWALWSDAAPCLCQQQETHGHKVPPFRTTPAACGAVCAQPCSGRAAFSLCATSRPSLGLLTVLPQPPCSADCTWTWEGQTHEKHHGITNTPDCRKMNVLPKRSGMRRVTSHRVPVSELSVLMICPRATLQNVNVFIEIPCDRLQVLIKGT